MKPQVTSAIAALLLSAAPALALDFGSGFSLTGDVELEYYDFDYGDSFYGFGFLTLDSSYGFGDLTLGWRSQSGGLGFDLTSVSLYDLDAGENISTLWGGLVVTTSFGEITVGRPRPILDTLSPAPDLGLSRTYGLKLGIFTGSYMASIGLNASDLNIYGATLQGSSGALSYGLGRHRLEQGSYSADVIELAGGYDVGATHIYGGYEKLKVPSRNNFSKQMIGARYSADRWAAGAEISHITLGPESGSIYSLYGEYEVMDGLTVGAQYLKFDEILGQSLFYGLTGEYSFGQGGFAQLGYVGSSNSSNNLASASIGFRF